MKFGIFLLFFCLWGQITAASPQWKWTSAGEESGMSGVSAAKEEDGNAADTLSEPENEVNSAPQSQFMFPSLFSMLSGSGGSENDIESIFALLDTDNSGDINAEEMFSVLQQNFKQLAEERFLQLDTDNDDKISAAEFASFYNNRLSNIKTAHNSADRSADELNFDFTEADTDKDNFLSISEFQHSWLKKMMPGSELLMQVFDTDEDGKITVDEFALFFNMGEMLNDKNLNE